ncbi:MAG: cation transporter dimerization domain-containing protein [Nanoarchaeota archaeon]|nr:cation transporter dimerization domain-containing protein [Nanoarchaeota archaeon]
MGVLLRVEVHIGVDKELTVYRAHAIGRKVQNKLERLEDVDRAFVHIDPGR